MIFKLEALGERKPPWPGQIIATILPNVIMLSLGGERLTPKVLHHYLDHDLGMLPLLWVFAHLLILEYPDHHQNAIISSLCYPGPLHKISSQSVCDFLNNVVYRQTDKQTNQRYQKHNLLWQGGNYCLVTLCQAASSRMLCHKVSMSVKLFLLCSRIHNFSPGQQLLYRNGKNGNIKFCMCTYG